MTTTPDLHTRIRTAARTAARIPHIIGTPTCPTPWDRAHHTIDALLDELDHHREEPHP